MVEPQVCNTAVKPIQAPRCRGSTAMVRKGWCIGNGDMVALYDWDSREFYFPIGVRIGKVFVGGKRQLELSRGVPEQCDLRQLARRCGRKLFSPQRDLQHASWILN